MFAEWLKIGSRAAVLRHAPYHALHDGQVGLNGRWIFVQGPVHIHSGVFTRYLRRIAGASPTLAARRDSHVPRSVSVFYIYPCPPMLDCQGPPAGQCIAKGSSDRIASQTGPMKDCIRTPMSSKAMGGGFNSPPWCP